MNSALLEAYETYLLQIKGALLSLGITLYDKMRYHRLTQKLTKIGFSSVLVKMAKTPDYQPIIKYMNLIHPQDAGFGSWYQQRLCLGQIRHPKKEILQQMAFLGGLHNLLMGFIDKIVDNYRNSASEFEEIFPKTLLQEFSTKEAMDSLESFLSRFKERKDTPANVLSYGVLRYLKDVQNFLAENVDDVKLWKEFIHQYVVMYENEFATADLTFERAKPSKNAVETVIIKTANVILPHVYLLLMSSTEQYTHKDDLIEAHVLLGKAMVISEDLCDLLEDITAKRWNYVTLQHAIKKGLSNTHFQDESTESLIREIALSDCLPEIIEEMVDVFSKAFNILNQIGKHQKTGEQMQFILSYPLTNATNKKSCLLDK